MGKIDQARDVRKQWIANLETALHRLDEGLDDLDARLRDLGPLGDQYQWAAGRIVGARDATADAVRQLADAAGDAWMVFARESERALDELQHDLRVTAEEVSGQLADARPQLVAVAGRLADAWRERLDPLRLQVELGRAEFGEALNDAWSTVEAARAEFRQRVDVITSDTTHTVEELWAGLARTSRHLREAVEAVTSLLRRRTAHT